MISRRHLHVLSLAVLLFACSRSKTDGVPEAPPAASASTSPASTKPTSPPPPPRGQRTTTYEGVEMIELFPHHADETSLLIVVIHGRGDNPKHWVDGWRAFPAKAHVVLPRAFESFGDDGWSWFDLRDGMTNEQLAKSVGDAEAKLWKGVVKVAGEKRLTSQKIVVTGFSQGGMLSFTIAARHPENVLHAYPLAGFCPKFLLPSAKGAPVSAFHGTDDRILAIQDDRDSVKAWKDKGNEAELKEYAGIGHTITKEMRHDWWNAILKVVPEQ